MHSYAFEMECNHAGIADEKKGPMQPTAPGLSVNAIAQLLMQWHQIDCCELAAAINLNVKLKPVTLVEVRHACPFNCRDVHERIRLSVIALHEAEALHRVEELDRASCFFASEFALGCAAAISTITAAKAAGSALRAITPLWTGAIFNRKRIAFDDQISRRDLSAAIHQCEAERLTISKARQASLFNRRNMHENILAAIIADNEAEALLRVEKFDDALAFTDNLRRHRRASRGTATGTKSAATATATAAEAIPAAAAETVSAASKAVSATATKPITAATAVAALVTETVALISAASATITAATFIETHAVSNFPSCFARVAQKNRARRTTGAGPLAQNHKAPVIRNILKIQVMRAIFF